MQKNNYVGGGAPFVSIKCFPSTSVAKLTSVNMLIVVTESANTRVKEPKISQNLCYQVR